MNASMLISVAFGGAVGAVARFTLMSGLGHYFQTGFPYATLLVNVLGSFLLGALIEISALSWSPGAEMRSFLVVGVLGAFTTFSTFSQDAWFLIVRGEMLHAGLYIGLSVFLSIAGLVAGLALLRQLLT